jgi:hypothetical protein
MRYFERLRWTIGSTQLVSIFVFTINTYFYCNRLYLDVNSSLNIEEFTKLVFGKSNLPLDLYYNY